MIHWKDIDIKEPIEKTATSLPLKSWASHNPVSFTTNHGCFRGEPNNYGNSLARPSAPKPCKKVVWPERLCCIEFKTNRKASLTHSRSCDNITVAHC